MSKRCLPAPGCHRASRILRGVLAHPWPATLGLAALAFIAVTAAGIANSGRAGLAGAAALAAAEASLIVFSFVAFGRTLGLRAVSGSSPEEGLIR